MHSPVKVTVPPALVPKKLYTKIKQSSLNPLHTPCFLTWVLGFSGCGVIFIAYLGCKKKFCNQG